MTALVEPLPDTDLVPPGSFRIRGVLRTRQEWERLEQVIFYFDIRPGGSYTLQHCVDAAWGGSAVGDPSWYGEDGAVWLKEIGAALDMGCTPYETAAEMKVAARSYILRQRRALDWCGEGTNSILGQLGLEPIEPSPYPRQEFINVFRQVVAAHYGQPDREGWIVRALLRGSPPPA